MNFLFKCILYYVIVSIAKALAKNKENEELILNENPEPDYLYDELLNNPAQDENAEKYLFKENIPNGKGKEFLSVWDYKAHSWFWEIPGVIKTLGKLNWGYPMTPVYEVIYETTDLLEAWKLLITEYSWMTIQNYNVYKEQSEMPVDFYLDVFFKNYEHDGYTFILGDYMELEGHSNNTELISLFGKIVSD